MSNLEVVRKHARRGVALFAAVLAIVVAPSGASAKHAKHVAHHKMSSQVQAAQASMTDSTQFGSMRYYGGPKSPMWREVR
jgi:hypothetical protein